MSRTPEPTDSDASPDDTQQPPPDFAARGDETPEAETPKAQSQDVAEALAQGIGGKSGLLDSGLPTAVFLIAYLATDSQLQPALWAAVATGVVVAIIRKIRGESLRHVTTGFLGVAIAAFFASRTGRAEDFFLPGILINIAYGSAFAISALVRRPIAGYAAGAVTGDLTTWRTDPDTYRGAVAVTWLWAGVFWLRVAVQLPLYFAGLVGALGVAKLAMGWPLFLLAGFVSYRILRPRLAALSRYSSSI